jgi:drug/metabolite transporter (DMT)-like permease
VAFRFTGGGLLLLLILRLFEPESRPGRKDLILMAALGCFGVAVAQSGFTFGVSLTSAASTGLIFATAPVWGLLLGAVLGLERPTIRGILGLALSVVGVAVVVFEGFGSGGDSLVGDLLVLMASVGVGGYTVLSMPLLERHTPLAVAGYPVVFGAPFLLVLSSPSLLDLEWGRVGAGPWAAVAFSAVFATAFAFAGWQRGISRIGANRDREDHRWSGYPDRCVVGPAAVRAWPRTRSGMLLPKSFCAACTDSTGWRMPLLVNKGKVLLKTLKTECEIRTGQQGW